MVSVEPHRPRWPTREAKAAGLSSLVARSSWPPTPYHMNQSSEERGKRLGLGLGGYGALDVHYPACTTPSHL